MLTAFIFKPNATRGSKIFTLFAEEEDEDKSVESLLWNKIIQQHYSVFILLYIYITTLLYSQFVFLAST